MVLRRADGCKGKKQKQEKKKIEIAGAGFTFLRGAEMERCRGAPQAVAPRRHPDNSKEG